MKLSYLLLLGVLLLLGPGQAACQVRGAPLSEEGAIKVAGVTRTYRIYVPDGVGRSESVPLVFVFHGGGGRADQIESGTGFSQLAAKEKFIVVYPQGLNNQWNDGRNAPLPEGNVSTEQEAAFIRSLVAEISGNYKIDRNRIFATGVSNGGFFSNFLGITMSDTFAAIAPVVGGIATGLAEGFGPKEPVSVFVIQGTADPLVPYGGGTVARNRGEFISTEQTLKLWRDHDKTKDRPEEIKVTNNDPGDGCSVEGYLWKGGKKGTEVQFYKMVGGGHGWPGHAQRLPRLIVGDLCMDFDATASVWEFFRSHPKK